MSIENNELRWCWNKVIAFVKAEKFDENLWLVFLCKEKIIRRLRFWNVRWVTQGMPKICIVRKFSFILIHLALVSVPSVVSTLSRLVRILLCSRLDKLLCSNNSKHHLRVLEPIDRHNLSRTRAADDHRGVCVDTFVGWLLMDQFSMNLFRSFSFKLNKFF